MGEQREVLDSMDHDFSRFTTWTVTSLSLMMDRSRVRINPDRTCGMAIDYCILKEGMSILRGRKYVPGMNSHERKMERKYYSVFT
nr:hypothetical protein [Tanacetum cinerariifolium]